MQEISWIESFTLTLDAVAIALPSGTMRWSGAIPVIGQIVAASEGRPRLQALNQSYISLQRNHEQCRSEPKPPV